MSLILLSANEFTILLLHWNFGPPSDEDSENNPLPESGCYLQIWKFIPLNLLAF